MDRIDLRITLTPVGAAALAGADDPPESSAVVLARVVEARAVAAQRWANHPFEVNADAPGSVLRNPPFRLPASATAGLTRRLEEGTLCTRRRGRAVATLALVGEQQEQEILVRHLLLAGEREALGKRVEEFAEAQAAHRGLEVRADWIGHESSPSSVMACCTHGSRA